MKKQKMQSIETKEDDKREAVFDSSTIEEIEKNIEEAMIRNQLAEIRSIQHAKEFRTTPIYD